MVRQYGIANDLLEDVKRILSNYPVDQALIFGSRARGDYISTSDIDLVIVGQNLDSTQLNLIKNDLDCLNTIYSFDIINLKNINKEKLKQNIAEEGVLFYDPNQ